MPEVMNPRQSGFSVTLWSNHWAAMNNFWRHFQRVAPLAYKGQPFTITLKILNLKKKSDKKIIVL
jgi:hypothetical protein